MKRDGKDCFLWMFVRWKERKTNTPCLKVCKKKWNLIIVNIILICKKKSIFISIPFSLKLKENISCFLLIEYSPAVKF
jgi:hypothetical protein